MRKREGSSATDDDDVVVVFLLLRFRASVGVRDVTRADPRDYRRRRRRRCVRAQRR